ncbi:cytochrome b5 isoform X2 [Osmia lignaria lignaria]|uniref:cytochrome b5 isoform X2 n=1 Tax=Osmia lignaria lignaria TaxID=1437193 RepID=UPI0014788AC8|nr:cytochrome b5-like isoform X2 [Osmia lignaria]
MASKNATADTASTKLYTREEVVKHNESNDLWLIIHNKVYDVTLFLDQHPGGEEVILDQGGKDGTEVFEDIGHSSDARKIMESYKIGEIVESERTEGNADGLTGIIDEESTSRCCIMM